MASRVFKLVTALLVVLLSAPRAGAFELGTRQDASKYCDATSKMCYQEITIRASLPVFRLAIPDTTAAPFDTILQIISPVSFGWAGFAWGGGMTLNPLVVAWPNGNKVVVSSRWATGRTLPASYRTATYTTLSSSVNSTHWAVEVVCSGCSRWTGGALRPTDLNTFAWAVSKKAPSQPSNPDSSFAEHSNVGMFTQDLTPARVSQSAFQQYVQSKKGAA